MTTDGRIRARLRASRERANRAKMTAWTTREREPSDDASELRTGPSARIASAWSLG
jgi:hypothetical protein